jgi:hypothetical protein
MIKLLLTHFSTFWDPLHHVYTVVRPKLAPMPKPMARGTSPCLLIRLERHPYNAIVWVEINPIENSVQTLPIASPGVKWTWRINNTEIIVSLHWANYSVGHLTRIINNKKRGFISRNTPRNSALVTVTNESFMKQTEYTSTNSKHFDLIYKAEW